MTWFKDRISLSQFDTREIYKTNSEKNSDSCVLSHYRLTCSLLSMLTSDQCVLGPDGNLLDASEIAWVNDPDDLIFHGGPPPAIVVAGS